MFSICEFQFHKGTIKTKTEEAYQQYQNVFQFHKGTIKTFLLLELTLLLLHFNSIKVQLKLIFVLFLKHLIIFQFHKGTIKTCADWSELDS